MALQLLTEAEARSQWSGDLTIVRQQRVAFEDLGVMVLRTIIVALVTLPLWRDLFIEFRIIPYWLALLSAAVLFYFTHSMGKDLQAARQQGAWLLVSNRKTVWLNFRSYWHWRWPATDKTILRLDGEDIDHLTLVKVLDQSPPQLSIHLRHPLPDEVMDRILEENHRLGQARFGHSRIRHGPVALEIGGQTLRVRWSRELPGLREVAEKLRLSFTFEPTRRIDHAQADLMAFVPRPSEDDLAEINALLRVGNRAGAIKKLRASTGISLADAKELIEQSLAAPPQDTHVGP